MSPLIGRLVAFCDDSRRSPFLVHALEFDQKTGRWLLLVSDVANGRIAIWEARDAFLLPESNDG